MPPRLLTLLSAVTLAASNLAVLESASAAELVVTVRDVKSAQGEIGCALYASAAGFPMDSTSARVIWLKAGQPNVSCRFDAIAAGTYAVAVSHDLNGNHLTDTNLLGIPTEDWGVSNNVRPFLRPPSFAEASITIGADEVKSIAVEIDH